MTDAQSPDDTGLVGTVLADRYRIVRMLGEGAMGTVYLGEHLRFGRMDAIKVLREGMDRDREATERFLRGARNASRINHPNVCTVYDFGDTGTGPQFLAMEFVDGETLADIIERDGRLPLERAVVIAQQTAAALDAAHEMGIVHRDLKPGNVMVSAGRDGRDRVKVVDFDIAKGSAEGEGAEVTRTGFVVGTPEYMSPEQLIGDPLDGRSDIYSLALVFIRTLTGKLPVRAESTQDLMVERLTQDPLSLAEIAPELSLPPRIQAAVDHALQRRRDDRPGVATEFAAALTGSVAAPAAPAARPAPAAASATIPPTSVSPPPLASPSIGGSRLVPLIVGGLGTVAVGGALVWALAGGEPESALGPGDPIVPPAAELTTDDGDPPVVQDDQTTTTASTDRVVEEPDDPVVEPPAELPLPDATVVEDLLFRQLTALTDRPAAAVFQAARDTAAVVWGETRHPDTVRALAAYVTASAFDADGRATDALTWARRATGLAPQNRGYQALLDALGGTP